MSVVPWHCRVVHASPPLYTMTPDDCTIVPVNPGPKGTSWVIQLPDTSSPVPPAAGDFYLVADPLGIVNIFHHLVVLGGPTYSIQGSALLDLKDAFAWAAFLFDARNRRWAVFQGQVP
jgi:hypothetical protein